MSRLDVMYQVLGAQPYFSPYSPYHHHHHHHHHHQQQQQQQKPSSDTKSSGAQGTESGVPPASVSGSVSAAIATATIKEEDKDPPPGAQYLNARCVLFTYFHGDIGAVVDQHFSRALSLHASSVYPPKAPRDSCFPMSQRNFPPSFWNSPHASASHSEVALAAGEAYGPPPPPPLHGHPDAWHPHAYALGAQGSGYPRAEVYGAAFDPRYGSLLVPSVRPHHRSAEPGGKGEPAWGPAFSGEMGVNAETGPPTQDKSKDLYWF
ncbi:transcription cofactor vestigial-like protein 2a [Stigmatopora nigra]